MLAQQIFLRSNHYKQFELLKFMSKRFASRTMKLPIKEDENTCRRPYEEVTIPAPWGHLAGKWYGSKDIRPIVGLHGWLDNAGTFDRLAPLLPQHLPFLSIDLPGHGLSSHYPDGMIYSAIDYVFLIRHIMDEMNWEKISILSHSLSSMNGFVFAALCRPEEVDLLIGLDGLKPLMRTPVKAVEFLRKCLENVSKFHKRRSNSCEPPSYSWDELVQRQYLGSEKSIALDCCEYVLQRNAQRSRHDPNKYYFSRDERLKVLMSYLLPHNTLLQMAKGIKIPYLFIKSLNSPYYEDKAEHDEVADVLRQNPLFEYYTVEGTHHVHLNEPQKIADIINPFITRWRPVEAP